MVEVRPMYPSGPSRRVIITAPTPGAPTTFLSASELQKKENTAIQLLFFKPKGQQQQQEAEAAPVATIMPQLPQVPSASIMPPTVIVEEPVAPLDLSCKKRDPEPTQTPVDLVVQQQPPQAETVLMPMVMTAAPSPSALPIPQPSVPLRQHSPVVPQLMPAGHLVVNNVCSSLDEPQFIPRSNSDASTCSNASSLSGDDRRLKRKEQNKAAAQTYRQRKKSFSDKIESEFDILSRKNTQLKQKQSKLEGQIGRMRSLLNEQIREAKKEESPEGGPSSTAKPEPLRPRASSLSWHPGKNAPPAAVTRLAPISRLAASPIAECPSTAPSPPPQTSPAPPAIAVIPAPAPVPVVAGPTTVCGPPAAAHPSNLMPAEGDFNTVGPMRARKYTWPLTLTGKDRKKEQNKLASRRFRQRRKQEMSHSDVEAAVLEKNNKRLREQCEAMERKINLLKEVINKVNAKMGTDLVAKARGGGEVDKVEEMQTEVKPPSSTAAAAFSSLSIHSPKREMMDE